MKTLPLTRGQHSLIDDDDYERVIAYKWLYDNGYAFRFIKTTEGRKRIFLHHFILQTQSCVDHINRNALDNQKSNLRIATKSQNGANSKLHKDNLTGLKGVRYHSNGMYQARLGQKSLGLFKTLAEAGLAYNAAAKVKYGEFAYQNNV